MNQKRKDKSAFPVVVWIMAVTIGLTPYAATGETGTQVKQTAEQAVAVDARTQQAVEKWEDEKQQLLAAIDQTRAHLQTKTWQHSKATDYRETLRRKIAELKRRATAMEKINVELLPLLDKTLEKLQSFVDSDFPWRQTERRQIISQTKQLLNDYDMGLLPKTRAVLEAVAGEMDMGHTVAVQEAEITIEGQPRQVRLLQVGRQGLYALTMDARHGYVWNGEQNDFKSLDKGRKSIENTMQMAEGTRILALSQLPMGRPESKTRPGGACADEK